MYQASFRTLAVLVIAATLGWLGWSMAGRALADEGDVQAAAPTSQPEPARQPASQPALAPASQPASQPAAPPSAEDVLDQILRKREESPLIDPVLPPETAPEPTRIDPAVAGIAPGAERTRLLREGQIIPMKRGRMVDAGVPTARWVFVFDADAGGLADPPMYLMPCLMLEDMEKIAAQRGDAAVFVVSGQVFTYHGANYLLPMLFQVAPDRGNLQP